MRIDIALGPLRGCALSRRFLRAIDGIGGEASMVRGVNQEIVSIQCLIRNNNRTSSYIQHSAVRYSLSMSSCHLENIQPPVLIPNSVRASGLGHIRFPNPLVIPNQRPPLGHSPSVISTLSSSLSGAISPAVPSQICHHNLAAPHCIQSRRQPLVSLNTLPASPNPSISSAPSLAAFPFPPLSSLPSRVPTNPASLQQTTGWEDEEEKMSSLSGFGTPGSHNPNKSYEVVNAPSDSVSSLCFSPKGNYLVATSWDNQVRCWEVMAGNSQAKASIVHDQPVLCSAWKDDGTTVFSGGCDKLVKMWPLMTGGQPTVVAAHDAPVKELAWIPQMNLLVTGSWDKTLRYWDTRQQQPVHTQQLPDRCYSLSVNHPLMVVATADRQLVVFNLQNPQTEYKRIASPLKYQTRCVAAFPDQQGFLVGSIEGRVGVHHLADDQQNKNFTFKCHREGNEIYAVNSLNFHPVHHTFATAGSDGAFNFWDKDSKQRLKAMTRCGYPIPCSAFNHDGSLYAYAACYDWSKGAENHNQATAKTYIFLHTVQDSEIKAKPRGGAGSRK